MRPPVTNYGWQNDSLEYVRNRIARMARVESAEITDIGAIKVVLSGGIDRALREDVLEVARRAMLPVHVFYRMPDGKVVGEEVAKTEWVGDYYKDLNVPGFGGSANSAPSSAPPEEVAAEPKGALKLRRVRAGTRGRPVVAWRLGQDELRVGTKVKFSKEAALQWSMGRTLNVRPGATAEVVQLASRRPIVFVKIGDHYNDVELPVHMLGHIFTTEKKLKESVDEAKRKKISPEFDRLMNAIGWGRDDDRDDVQGNSPAFIDRYVARDQEFEEDCDSDEDVLVPDDSNEKKPERFQKSVIVDKRKR